MTTGFEKKPSQLTDLLLRSTFWMATFVAAVALSGAQAVASTLGYVSNLFDNTVSAVNTATNTAVATVTVGNLPSSIVVTPDQTHVYVVNAFDSTVSVISTATNTVVGLPIPVGPSLAGEFIGGIAITPSGSSVYVANIGGNSVSVIATASNTVVDTITVGNAPPDCHHARWNSRLCPKCIRQHHLSNRHRH